MFGGSEAGQFVGDNKKSSEDALRQQEVFTSFFVCVFPGSAGGISAQAENDRNLVGGAYWTLANAFRAAKMAREDDEIAG